MILLEELQLQPIRYLQARRLPSLVFTSKVILARVEGLKPFPLSQVRAAMVRRTEKGVELLLFTAVDPRPWMLDWGTIRCAPALLGGRPISPAQLFLHLLTEACPHLVTDHPTLAVLAGQPATATNQMDLLGALAAAALAADPRQPAAPPAQAPPQQTGAAPAPTPPAAIHAPAPPAQPVTAPPSGARPAPPSSAAARPSAAGQLAMAPPRQPRQPAPQPLAPQPAAPQPLAPQPVTPQPVAPQPAPPQPVARPVSSAAAVTPPAAVMQPATTPPGPVQPAARPPAAAAPPAGAAARPHHAVPRAAVRPPSPAPPAVTHPAPSPPPVAQPAAARPGAPQHAQAGQAAAPIAAAPQAAAPTATTHVSPQAAPPQVATSSTATPPTSAYAQAAAARQQPTATQPPTGAAHAPAPPPSLVGQPLLFALMLVFFLYFEIQRFDLTASLQLAPSMSGLVGLVIFGGVFFAAKLSMALVCIGMIFTRIREAAPFCRLSLSYLMIFSLLEVGLYWMLTTSQTSLPGASSTAERLPPQALEAFGKQLTLSGLLTAIAAMLWWFYWRRIETSLDAASAGPAANARALHPAPLTGWRRPLPIAAALFAGLLSIWALRPHLPPLDGSSEQEAVSADASTDPRRPSPQAAPPAPPRNVIYREPDYSGFGAPAGRPANDSTVIPLGGIATAMAVGVSGDFLFYGLPGEKEIVVIDPALGSIVERLPGFGPYIYLAASRDILVAGSRGRPVRRWWIPDFERVAEKDTYLPSLNGNILGLTMGCDSNGPLVAYGRLRSPSRVGLVFFDPETFEVLGTTDREDISGLHSNFTFRASADGSVFTGWGPSSATDSVVLQFDGEQIAVESNALDAWAVLPNADGSKLYAGLTVLDQELELIDLRLQITLPATLGTDQIILRSEKAPTNRTTGLGWALQDGDTGSTLLRVDNAVELDRANPNSGIPYDQRFVVLPDLGVVAILASSNDHLILHNY